MGSNNTVNDCPIQSSSSSLQYLKQYCAVVESTEGRNINKEIAIMKTREVKEDRKLKERESRMEVSIQEAEAKGVELRQILEVQKEKLKKLNKDEADQIEVLNSDIKTFQRKQEQLTEKGRNDMEYVSFFGKFVTSAMKLDWKKEPGNLRCPEGKLLGSAAEPDGCDFWNCPAHNRTNSNSNTN